MNSPDRVNSQYTVHTDFILAYYEGVDLYGQGTISTIDYYYSATVRYNNNTAMVFQLLASFPSMHSSKKVESSRIVSMYVLG